MISKSTLAKTYASGDLTAYGKELLVYYKQCAGSSPRGVCTDKFLTDHVVKTGGLNQNTAMKILQRRSKDFTEDFTSTLLTVKGVKKVCQALTKKGLLHGHVFRSKTMSEKATKNYYITSVEVIVMEYQLKRDLKTYQRTRLKVCLGLNKFGYIHHFHG